MVKELTETDHSVKNVDHLSYMLKMITYNMVSVLYQVFNFNVLIALTY